MQRNVETFYCLSTSTKIYDYNTTDNDHRFLLCSSFSWCYGNSFQTEGMERWDDLQGIGNCVLSTQSNLIMSDYCGGGLECYQVLLLRLLNRVNFPVEINWNYSLPCLIKLKISKRESLLYFAKLNPHHVNSEHIEEEWGKHQIMLKSS